MSLYYCTTTEPMFEGTLSVGPGSCIVIPIELAPKTCLDIICSQSPINDIANTEDFSLRVWISNANGGNPICSYPSYLASLIPNRYPSAKFFSLYDVVKPPSNKLYPIGANPGSYFFNILNLINSQNACIVEMSQSNL